VLEQVSMHGTLCCNVGSLVHIKTIWCIKPITNASAYKSNVVDGT